MRQTSSPSAWPTAPAGALLALVSLNLVNLACDGDLSKAEPPSTTHLVAGDVRLVGDGVTSCSHQPLSARGSADRWCAFTVGEKIGTPATLWVLNVTKARTAKVVCDGTSPHCLRLTSELWTGEPPFAPSHPYVHGFYGDSLFFYTGPVVEDEAFTGVIHGWRPGMAGPVALTGDKGIFCFGHERVAAAGCLSNQVSPGPTESIEFDLQAGPIQTMPGVAGVLPVLERVRPFEPDGSLTWGAQFSPTGEYFAFATKVDDMVTPRGQRPVVRLRAVPTAQLGLAAPTEVVRGLQEWSFSPDGRKLFFLRRPATGTSSLMAADFPGGGAAPVELATGVRRFEVYGEVGGPLLGLGLFIPTGDSLTTFRLLRDLDNPASSLTVAEGVENMQVSPDLRYSFFQDSAGADNARSLIVRNDGSGRLCPLTRNAGQFSFSVRFLPNQRVLFSEDAVVTDRTSLDQPIEGWIASSEDCGEAQRYSSNLAYTRPTPGGLLYGEQDKGVFTMSMHHVPFLPSGQLALDKVSHFAMGADYTSALLDEKLFVYTVPDGPETTNAGLFVHGPLP
ncbi:MAG TPA: hypothetical protein VGF45_08660 [Polyangia bacterium]